MTEAPAALSIVSNVGSAARIFSPFTVSGPAIIFTLEAKAPGVHHQVTMWMLCLCARFCSFSRKAVFLSFIA